ncbi:hypothetical protein MRX96_054419 [Rhipicephalus microplus]
MRSTKQTQQFAEGKRNADTGSACVDRVSQSQNASEDHFSILRATLCWCCKQPWIKVARRIGTGAANMCALGRAAIDEGVLAERMAAGEDDMPGERGSRTTRCHR